MPGRRRDQMQDFIDILKIAPSVLWFLLVVTLLVTSRKPIRDDLIPRLSGLKAMGVERSFVQGTITSGSTIATSDECSGVSA